jgi:hypothetical protein
MDKKLNPFIEFGISPSYMISIRNKSKTNIETVTEFGEIVDQINRIHLIGNGAIGLNYKLKKQLQVFGQSVVRYHFTNLYKSDLQTNLYNYGLEIGIRRMLN